MDRLEGLGHNSDRLTAAEAQEVVKLQARMASEDGAYLSIDDLAEVLRTTPEQARGLLSKVRSESTQSNSVSEKNAPVFNKLGANRENLVLVVSLAATMLLMFFLVHSVKLLVRKGGTATETKIVGPMTPPRNPELDSSFTAPPVPGQLSPSKVHRP
jgi:hypothetical protein